MISIFWLLNDYGLASRAVNLGAGVNSVNSWAGVWMISKKNFLQALVGRKELHAAQMK